MTNPTTPKVQPRPRNDKLRIATWVAGAVLVTLLIVWMFNLDRGVVQPEQPPAPTATATPEPETEEAPEDSYPQTVEEDYVYSHAYSLISGIAEQLFEKYGEEKMGEFQLSMDFADKDYFGEDAEAAVISSIANLPSDLDADAVVASVKEGFAEGTTWVVEERDSLPEDSEEVANFVGFTMYDADEKARLGNYIMYVDIFQKEEGGEWVMSFNSSVSEPLPEDLRKEYEESKKGDPADNPAGTETPATPEPTEEDGQ